MSHCPLIRRLRARRRPRPETGARKRKPGTNAMLELSHLFLPLARRPFWLTVTAFAALVAFGLGSLLT